MYRVDLAHVRRIIYVGVPHNLRICAILKLCCAFSESQDYTTGTCISSVAVYSNFTSKSPDYILGKAGLFSTEPSVPELCYFTRYTQSRHILVGSLDVVDRNHVKVSACARWGERLRTIVAQS